MKKILVPIDFSENAKSALEYALKLADETKALLKVVHVYHLTPQQVEGFLVYPDDEMRESLNKRMHSFIESCFDKPIDDILLGELLTYDLEIGFATDKIVEYSESGEYDLIIMGATGKTGMLEKVIGKISGHVAKNADCPVILIPAGVPYQSIKEIMYASEYESADEEVLIDLQNFSKNFEANIHLVHVYDVQEKQPEGVGHFLLEKAFQIKAPSLKFTMEYVTSDSVAHGLESYAAENKMDLMVLVKPQRKLWQRLLHKSQTNEIIMNPQIPLMVMH